MQGNFTNPSMISPLSDLRRLYPAEYGGGHGHGTTSGSSPSMVTPCGSGGTSLEQQFMARRMMRQREDYNNSMGAVSSSSRQYISPADRADVSRAVYGILRDNLPPSLECTTPPGDILAIANSIETKLYQTAPSPRAYSALSTLEFRITALATAVLIHSDGGSEGGGGRGGGISETCARLSAAARKSLVYCVMVLISYEKRNLDKFDGSSNNGGSSSRYQYPPPPSSYSKQKDHHHQHPHHTGDNSQSKSTRYDDGKSKSSPNNGGGADGKASVQLVVEDSQQVQPFPPSA